MDRLSSLVTGAATAITFAIVSTVCAVAVVAAPDATLGFFNAWFHGLDLAPLKSARPLTLGGFFRGLVGVAIFGFLLGALFGWSVNLVNRR